MKTSERIKIVEEIQLPFPAASDFTSTHRKRCVLKDERETSSFFMTLCNGDFVFSFRESEHITCMFGTPGIRDSKDSIPGHKTGLEALKRYRDLGISIAFPTSSSFYSTRQKVG